MTGMDVKQSLNKHSLPVLTRRVSVEADHLERPLLAFAQSKAQYWGYDGEFMEACRAELGVGGMIFLPSSVYPGSARPASRGLHRLRVQGTTAMLSDLFVEPHAIDKATESSSGSIRQLQLPRTSAVSPCPAKAIHKPKAFISYGSVESGETSLHGLFLAGCHRSCGFCPALTPHVWMKRIAIRDILSRRRYPSECSQCKAWSRPTTEVPRICPNCVNNHAPRSVQSRFVSLVVP